MIHPAKFILLSFGVILILSCSKTDKPTQATSNPPPIVYPKRNVDIQGWVLNGFDTIAGVFTTVSGDYITGHDTFPVSHGPTMIGSGTYSGTFSVPTVGASWQVSVIVKNPRNKKTGEAVITIDSSDTAIYLDVNNGNVRLVADAGPDTMVYQNTAIHLHATVIDSFGGPVATAWDIGAKGVFRPSPPDTQILAPDTMMSSPFHPFRCAFRAMDANGDIVTDTVYIRILSDTIHYLDGNSGLAASEILDMADLELPVPRSPRFIADSFPQEIIVEPWNYDSSQSVFIRKSQKRYHPNSDIRDRTDSVYFYTHGAWGRPESLLAIDTIRHIRHVSRNENGLVTNLRFDLLIVLSKDSIPCQAYVDLGSITGSYNGEKLSLSIVTWLTRPYQDSVWAPPTFGDIDIRRSNRTILIKFKQTATLRATVMIGWGGPEWIISVDPITGSEAVLAYH